MVETFAGKLAWSQYDFFTRLLLKLVLRALHRPAEERDTSHDHDYTDYDAVRRFAEAFAETVAAAGRERDLASRLIGRDPRQTYGNSPEAGFVPAPPGRPDRRDGSAHRAGGSGAQRTAPTRLMLTKDRADRQVSCSFAGALTGETAL